MTHANPLVLDGNAVADSIKARLEARIAGLTERGITPCLATVLVGDDPASATYVRMKRNRCEKAGIDSLRVDCPPATTTRTSWSRSITELSQDPTVHGILLQHPGAGARRRTRGVRGDRPGQGRRRRHDARRSRRWRSATPGFASVHAGRDHAPARRVRRRIRGQHAVVIGRSPILGKPVGMLLLACARDRHRTATRGPRPARDRAHRGHRRRRGRQTELRPRRLDQAGRGVVDAGYNAGNVGDVASRKRPRSRRLITPVPGGVGPMTIAVLLEQTVDAAERLGA